MSATSQRRPADWSPLRPLPLDRVHVSDAFWSARQALVADAMLPHQWAELTRRGYLANFRAVAPGGDRTHSGPLFADSDLYKWVEAAAYVVGSHTAAVGSGGLPAHVAEAAEVIEAAQCPDGYVNTYHQSGGCRRRWTAPLVDHELYCAGHLMEAACALDEACGERGLLDVAVRFADHIGERFEDPESGVPGHEEVEMALVRLADRTGNNEYVDLARRLIERRGRVNRYPAALLRDAMRAARTAVGMRRRRRSNPIRGGMDAEETAFGFAYGSPAVWPRIAGQFLSGAYFQDRVPVEEHEVAEGHAVRATYLYAGTADVALAQQDSDLVRHLGGIWARTTGRRAYVTGAMGSLPAVEGFGRDYELPNRAYAETCAAIGGFLWSWRMLLARGEARYADWMERALYNAVLSGASLDGRRYFYQNPLVSHGGEERRPWYVVACCPPNIARVLGSLQRYVFTETDGGVQVHQWIGATARTRTAGSDVEVRVKSEVPSDGKAEVRVAAQPPVRFSLKLRVPEWADGLTVSVNGSPARVAVGQDGFVELSRLWGDDTIDVGFGVAARIVQSPAQVKANRGRGALKLGPLIYCVQASDNPGVDVHGLQLAGRDPEIDSELAGAPVLSISTAGGMSARAVPYFAWCNDGATDMAVWIRRGAKRRGGVKPP